MSGRWRVTGSRMVYADPWIRLRSDSCVTSEGRFVGPYHVLEYPDWIHVIAITSDDQIVLVKQYRHAVGEVLLELPAGSVGPGDADSAAAARRELLEETGYEADALHLLGWTYVNPATHTNRVWTYLAADAHAVHEPRLDPCEVLEVAVRDAGEFLSNVLDGRLALQALHLAGIAFMQRALSLGALGARFEPLRRRLP